MTSLSPSGFELWAFREGTYGVEDGVEDGMATSHKQPSNKQSLDS